MNEAGIRTIEAQPTIAVRIVTTVDQLSSVFDTELPRVSAGMEQVGAVMVGPPFARYHTFGPDRVDVELGAPIAGPGPWEVYLTDPQRAPDPADWLTEVIWPLA
jgi:hypothetical protein